MCYLVLFGILEIPALLTPYHAWLRWSASRLPVDVAGVDARATRRARRQNAAHVVTATRPLDRHTFRRDKLLAAAVGHRSPIQRDNVPIQ